MKLFRIAFGQFLFLLKSAVQVPMFGMWVFSVFLFLGLLVTEVFGGYIPFIPNLFDFQGQEKHFVFDETDVAKWYGYGTLILYVVRLFLRKIFALKEVSLQRKLAWSMGAVTLLYICIFALLPFVQLADYHTRGEFAFLTFLFFQGTLVITIIGIDFGHVINSALRWLENSEIMGR